MGLIVGRIYFWKASNSLFRIFKEGGVDFYSGRGCTKITATPSNFIREADVRPATLNEVNYFLETEMAEGMCQTINK